MTRTKPITKMSREQKDLVEQYKHLIYSKYFNYLYKESMTFMVHEEVASLLLYSLCLAAAAYKPEKKTKFLTYAISYMRLTYKRLYNYERMLINAPRLCSDTNIRDTRFINTSVEASTLTYIMDLHKQDEDFSKVLDITSQLQKLKSIINTLPEDDKKLILLRYFSGDKVISYEKLTKYFGITANGIKHRLDKILIVLKKRMSN